VPPCFVIKKGSAVYKAKSVHQAIKYLEDELDEANSVGGIDSNDEPVDQIWG
jgi:hypothetical protein